MPKLILLRHLQSQWNEENRFTGWVDVPLSRKGIEDVGRVSQKLYQQDFDIVYTSPLMRNQDTVARVFEGINKKYPIFRHFGGKMESWAKFESAGNYFERSEKQGSDRRSDSYFKRSEKQGSDRRSGSYIPVFVSEKLNERYYGKLQGLNKQEISAKYGQEKVQQWRRGFKQGPPGGETMKDTFNRVIPFYKKYIEHDLKKGKNVLVVASHNSLRALIKHIEKISDQDIMNVEMMPASLVEYEIDEKLQIKNKLVR